MLNNFNKESFMTPINGTSKIDYDVGSALKLAGSGVGMVTSVATTFFQAAIVASIVDIIADAIIFREDVKLEEKLENGMETFVISGIAWSMSTSLNEIAKQINAFGSCLKSCSCSALKGCFFERIAKELQTQS
jgi:uncharacterized membrane protein YvlD (DUF360 family)